MANDINVKVTADTSQAEREVKELTRGVDKSSKAMVASFNKVDLAVASFAGNIAANLAGSALNALSNQLAKSTREFLDFQKALKEIATISNFTAKETAVFTKELEDLSSQFATTQQAQAKAFYQIVSSGTTDATEATKLLAAANQLALGGLADLGGSINVLTDIVNVYGKENISAQEAADSLFKTVQLGKTTIEQLQGSIGQVLPAAKQLGVGLDEVGAALATLTTQGLSTAERTTQLNALFTALFRKSGKEAFKFGKEVGEAFSITALRTKGLVKFLEDLQKATGGNETTLQKLLGRTEAVKAVFGLTGDQLDVFNGKLDEYQNKAGSAAAASEKIKEGLDFQLDQLSQNFTNLGAAIIKDLEPALTASVKLLNELFGPREAPEGFTEITARIDELTKKSEILADRRQAGAKVRKQQIDEEIAKLKELREAEANRGLDLGDGDFGPQLPKQEEPAAGDGGENPVVKQTEESKKALIDLQAFKEQIALEEEERDLLAREAAGIASEEDLAQLQQFELAKLAAKQQAEFDKTSLIADEDKKRLALKKLEAKQQLEIEKVITKQTIKEAKNRAAEQKIIDQAKFQTAVNFLNAGINLTKQGSSAQKALASSLALVNTYQAATAALAPPPIGAGPIFGPVLAASTIALGLSNVAKINGIGFQDGGIVGGSSFSGDNIPARVNSGEMILNREQQANLFEVARTGGQNEAPPVINIQGNVIADDESQVNDLIDRIKSQIEFRNAGAF